MFRMPMIWFQGTDRRLRMLGDRRATASPRARQVMDDPDLYEFVPLERCATFELYLRI
jgi:hypothetical protein